jgi:hypothetical protein
LHSLSNQRNRDVALLADDAAEQKLPLKRSEKKQQESPMSLAFTIMIHILRRRHPIPSITLCLDAKFLYQEYTIREKRSSALQKQY